MRSVSLPVFAEILAQADSRRTDIAIQLDGVITRTAELSGTLFAIGSTWDFEFLSLSGNGAILGEGYIYHEAGSISGPRLVRLTSVTDFSVHDIKLVDSPSFHMTLDTCENGEVYNILIRGGYEGGLDGIDVTATNTWVHDIEVTNKDECVTVKSPSSNLLIEQIYCNWSGGCAIGSLGTDTAISNVVYDKVYTIYSNQMMLIKSNGGSGYVENVLFENFIGHENAYSLYVDQTWGNVASGSGVSLTNITFKVHTFRPHLLIRSSTNTIHPDLARRRSKWRNPRPYPIWLRPRHALHRDDSHRLRHVD